MVKTPLIFQAFSNYVYHKFSSLASASLVLIYQLHLQGCGQNLLVEGPHSISTEAGQRFEGLMTQPQNTAILMSHSLENSQEVPVHFLPNARIICNEI
jgi:hypothetical protein